MNCAEEIKLILRSDIFLSADKRGNFTRIFFHIESKRTIERLGSNKTCYVNPVSRLESTANCIVSLLCEICRVDVLLIGSLPSQMCRRV